MRGILVRRGLFAIVNLTNVLFLRSFNSVSLVHYLRDRSLIAGKPSRLIEVMELPSISNPCKLVKLRIESVSLRVTFYKRKIYNKGAVTFLSVLIGESNIFNYVNSWQLITK